MITKQRALFYFVGDKSFKDLVEAQKFDLQSLVPESIVSFSPEALSSWMLEHAAEIVDILTTTPTSRLRARKTHGGTRKKKVKLTPAVVKEPPAKP